MHSIAATAILLGFEMGRQISMVIGFVLCHA
jgi:hypothetical protein